MPVETQTLENMIPTNLAKSAPAVNTTATVTEKNIEYLKPLKQFVKGKEVQPLKKNITSTAEVKTSAKPGKEVNNNATRKLSYYPDNASNQPSHNKTNRNLPNSNIIPKQNETDERKRVDRNADIWKESKQKEKELDDVSKMIKKNVSQITHNNKE